MSIQIYVHIPLSEDIKLIIALIALEDKFWNHAVKIQIWFYTV